MAATWVTEVGSADEYLPTHWQGLDLTGASFIGLRLFGTTVTDCVFDGALFENPSTWGIEVTDCSFRGAKFSRASLGPGDWLERQTSYLRTAFDGARFDSAHMTDASLQECSFDGIKYFTFTACRFKDVVVKGVVHCSTFSIDVMGGPAHEMGIDFSQATFNGAEVRGYELDERFRQPQGEWVRVIRGYPLVFPAARAILVDEFHHPEWMADVVLGLTPGLPLNPRADTCFDLGDPLDHREDQMTADLDATFRRLGAYD